jgi:hypothetical protein
MEWLIHRIITNKSQIIFWVDAVINGMRKHKYGDTSEFNFLCLQRKEVLIWGNEKKKNNNKAN